MAQRPSSRSSAGTTNASTHPPTSFPLSLNPVSPAVPSSGNGASASPFPPPSGLSLPGGADGSSTYTTAELSRDFANDEICLEFVKEQVWPKGLAPCLKCGVSRKHYRVSGRKAYACNHCGHHIYPLANTIFAKSTTPLRKWFYILYLMLATRGLLSARQIQRETGVTYKTAWRSRAQILALLPAHNLQAAGPEALLEKEPAPSEDGGHEFESAMAGQALEGPREEIRKKMRRVKREEFMALVQRAIQTSSRKSAAAAAGASGALVAE